MRHESRTSGPSRTSYRPAQTSWWMSSGGVQYALEQMGIRTNGNLLKNKLASFSRTNGNSNKWESEEWEHSQWHKMGSSLLLICCFSFVLALLKCTLCFLNWKQPIFNVWYLHSEKYTNVFSALCMLPTSIIRTTLTYFRCFLSQHKYNINVFI